MESTVEQNRPTGQTLSKPEILKQAFQRCVVYGLQADGDQGEQRITERRIHDLEKENRPLLGHVESIFERIEPYISAAGHVALFADANGNILHEMGSTDFLTRAQRVQLELGANWHEKLKGTNGIGTALAEKTPIRIHGSEHYFQDNGFLTCSAAPVFSPAGDVLGVVDISGCLKRDFPLALPMAILAAENLQTRLLLEEARHETLLLIEDIDNLAQMFSRPLVSIDQDRRIVRANGSARRLLGGDWQGQICDQQLLEARRLTMRTLWKSPHRIWSLTSAGARDGARGTNQNLRFTFDDIFARCDRMRRAIRLGERAAGTDLPVLLSGESGTGKELFAQSIHRASDRAEKPFIAINCSAIPESLIESELFGYESGAFTGARKNGAPGKFEAADGGTLFLDEIGDMDLRAQAALLRVLQEQVITRVGAVRDRRVDVRIVAATHQHLPDEIREGRFRADLYYRLKGILIRIPTLRERRDILPLAQELLRRSGQANLTFSPAARKKLLAHGWPGNVRELQSVLARAIFLADHTEISPQDLILDDESEEEPPVDEPGNSSITLRTAENLAIRRALRTTRGNIKRAAGMLGIGRNTLYRKMREHGIDREP